MSPQSTTHGIFSTRTSPEARWPRPWIPAAVDNERLRDHDVLPCDDLPGRVEAGLHRVERQRSGRPAAEVFFARPDQLDRPSGCARDERGLQHDVGLDPLSEATSEIVLVD